MSHSMKDASQLCQEECFARRSILLRQQVSIRRMQSSVDLFLQNVERLLLARKWSNRRLAKESGVSDRLIGMYRNREAVPSLDKAEKIANALGFALWQLQMPDLPAEALKGKRLNRVLYAYVEADEKGRELMEAQAEYIVKKEEPPANDPKAVKNVKQSDS